ncbi:MAG: methionyl-tRNA formyltransferase [candidate division NC10 bacterium]|nr:methionyl-tRNA formyltransferase [candidate division NC10 bacterium]
MSKPLRVIFMGSPAFAVPSLTRLLADGQTLALVVTQPDRPAGRGQDLRPPPVKRAAERHGLRILQPEKLNDPDVQATLAAAQPDVIAVAAFGQFLPRAVRELPPLGCVNVHASLLPKYRGAAPINWALIAGETETGITIMRIEEGMDAGPTLLQRAIPIAPEDDAGTLHDRLADLGAAALADALALVARGEAVWTSQDEGRATKAPKIRDEDCRLELAGDPGPLVNRILGLSPAPGAYLTWRGQRLKALRAEKRPGAAEPGMILAVESQGIVCGTGDGAIALLEVQPEGKRRMTGAEFARGQRLQAGARLT